ncbi:MAG TPA: hypothetical protein VNN81_11190 [Bradyrhizobium sp.]|nr:hypothetical protein [Bradyrhizobium sp.]
MMILYGFGGFRPFWRAQTWACEHLIPVLCTPGDLRWAVAALALRSFAALDAFAEKQLVSLAQNVMGRALQGARFAADMTAADTTVAAGGG